MDTVSVFRFEVWDPEAREFRGQPLYATLRAIEAVRGLALPETRIEVAKSDVTSAGMHQPQAARAPRQAGHHLLDAEVD